MSKYDKEREALGLKSSSSASTASQPINTNSKYASERQQILSNKSVSVNTDKYNIKPTTAKDNLKKVFGDPVIPDAGARSYTKLRKQLEEKKKVVDLIGEEAYNTLPVRGNYPGQLPNDISNPNYEEDYYKSIDWAKNNPGAAAKLNQVRMANEKYGPIQTFAMNAIDSAALGVPSRITKALYPGGVDPLTVSRQQNPIAATAGNIAGYITPGAGAEKAAGAVLKPVLSKIGSKLGQTALKGAAAGAGMEAVEGTIRGENPLDIVQRTAVGAGLGGAGNAAFYGLGKLINKLRSGGKATAEEVTALKEAADQDPELLQLPEVRRLLLPERTTSKIELGPANIIPEPEIQPRRPDFIASERNIARSMEDFKTPTRQPLMLPEGTRTGTIQLNKIPAVAPKTIPGKMYVKNVGYEKALNDYNNAIERIHNYFQTNELRPDEIPIIKSELGIDLEDIVNRLSKYESQTGRDILNQAADISRIKRVSGIGNDKAYNVLEKVKELSSKKIIPDYNAAKRTENPFVVTKGELKKIPKGTTKLSSKIKEQQAKEAYIKGGEYKGTEKRFDFINAPAVVKETPNMYANAKGQIERPFVEVRGKVLDPEINKNVKGIPVPPQSATPSNEALGFLPKGFKVNLKNNTSGYVSETATKIKNTKDLKPGGSLWDKFYRNFIDSQKSIKDFSKAAGQTDLKTDVLASNSRNVGGTVDYILREGLVDKSGKEISNSFKSVVDNIPRKQEKAFNDYMLHRHNIARMNEGKPVFGDEITPEKSLEIIKNYEQSYPQFKQAAEQYDKFMNDFMEEWGVKSGLIDNDTWLKLKEKYPNYVPTYRVFSEVEKVGKGFGGSGQRFVNVPNVFKKATGSQRDIINPLEKTMELVDKTVKAAKYNEVGQSIVTALRESPEDLKAWAEIVTEPKQGLLDDINSTLKDEGLEGLMDKFNQQFDQVFNKKPTGNNIVRVMENGKPVYVKINEPELLKAITGLTKSQPGAIEGFVRKYLTNPFKSLITGKNPIFAVTNIARDIPTAYINGAEKNPVKFFKNLATAAKDMASNSQMYKEYKAIGGKYSSYFKSDINKLYKGPGKLETFNTFIESLPRYAEYRRAVLKGGNNYISKMQGLYNAAEVTTNFARNGNIAKTIDAFVPYFNPAMQGLAKLVRQVKNNPFSTVGKGVFIITIPNVGLYFLNKDNPWYGKLDNRTKDGNYCIPNYLGPKDENGNPETFIKIPKAREYGAILGAFFERAIRMANGEPEPFKGYGTTLKTNFAPNLSTIANPLINLGTNKDFAGRTIVPGNLQNLSPRYQYDETSTEIAKWIGDKLNLSPKQLDYLGKSYLGVIAQFGQPLTTAQTYSSNDGLQENIGNSSKNVLKRKFIADPAFSNDEVSDFYDNKSTLDTAYNDFKKKKVKSDDLNIPLKKQFGNVSEKFSKMYDKIDAVNQDKKLSSAEKEEKIRVIRKEILNLSEKANDKYKKK